MRFSGKHGGIDVKLDRVEAAALSAMAVDLLELLGAQEAQEQDPLAALVGLSSEPVERPADPALARLLPDAYRDDDQAAGDFRRYTEADLRAGKRAQATAVLVSLEPYGQGGRLTMDRDLADAWLGCLNDLRLVLGTRLEVTEDTDLDVGSDDPRAQPLYVYGWLGWVQEALLDAMARAAR